MHNLLLGMLYCCWRRLIAHDLSGVIKTQWYNMWISRKPPSLRANTETRDRELDIIHSFLETVRQTLIIAGLMNKSPLQFEAPSWAGSLPSKVGELAGGSLTAVSIDMQQLARFP